MKLDDEKIIRVIGEIDNSLIEEADLSRIKKKNKSNIIKIGTGIVTLAACLLIFLVVVKPAVFKNSQNTQFPDDVFINESQNNSDYISANNNSGTGDTNSGNDSEASDSVDAGLITKVEQISLTEKKLRFTYGEYVLSFILPNTWNYRAAAFTRSDGVKQMKVCIYPENESDNVTFSYGSTLGVCGTGLVEKELNFGSVKTRAGYFGNSSRWSFLVFLDENNEKTPLYANRKYTETQETSSYENELNKIISTIVTK